MISDRGYGKIRVMKGQSSTAQRGFTIIEVMIYLAIAGVMFTLTLFYLGDKQRATQFSQGVREFESTLNDVANDTATGVFPSSNDIRCVDTGSGIAFQELSAVEKVPGDPVQPGENNQCVFVGSVVQLTNDEAGKSAAEYFVHTLVGVNNVATGGSNSFEGTAPKALFQNSVIDGTREYSIPWGVEIKKAYIQSADGSTFTDINGVGYLYSSFGDSLSVGSQIKTGVASVALYVREANSKLSLDDYRNSINYEANPALELLKKAGDRTIHICINGVDGRTSMIEIGGQSGSFAARTNNTISARCAAP